jgi:glutamate racemase
MGFINPRSWVRPPPLVHITIRLEVYLPRMNNNPIGILDSGLGGLTILKAITKELPHESIVYAGDSANTPYGSKSESEMYLRAKQIVEFLLSKNVKIIVIACNTITVNNVHRLREEYPHLPIIGTVPVVKTAASVTKNKRIGILSTTSTAQSDYQKKLIEDFASDCIVFNQGTDELVPLIEKGEQDGEEMKRVLKKTLSTFQKEGIDTLVLGCTHFPFVEKQMGDILGSQVKLLDSGGAIARQVKRILTENNSLAEETEPFLHVFTTGNIQIATKLLKDVIKSQALRVESFTYEYKQ